MRNDRRSSLALYTTNNELQSYIEVKIAQAAQDLAFYTFSPKEKMESVCFLFSMPLKGIPLSFFFLRKSFKCSKEVSLLYKHSFL